ncbi:MAG TPA: response regulator [Usitatibacteraceae bacterium]|nr:response regulator [Usitatibacteraceae bacterium]
MSTPPFHRILHVDDQPDIRGIVKLALGKIGGFSVCSCGSGEEALAAARDFDPQLLLIDMNMPGMDGMDLLVRLREAGTLAPAVFFTARINPSDVERYRAAGAIGTVSKPFDPLKLGRQITAVWMDNFPTKDPTP